MSRAILQRNSMNRSVHAHVWEGQGPAAIPRDSLILKSLRQRARAWQTL